MKIIDYNLSWAINSTALNVVVNQDIKNGWQPYGQPFNSVDDKRLYQAMVKYDLSWENYR